MIIVVCYATTEVTPPQGQKEEFSDAIQVMN